MIRRKTRQITLGNVKIGGKAPISVQSMTKTRTSDLTATIAQIHALEQAGCDIVRVAVPDRASARAIKKIRQETEIPLIADIHFHHHLALQAIESGADGVRINPGNITSKKKVREVVLAAKERAVPIRIGVNAGSLEKGIVKKYGAPTPQALVESSMHWIRFCEEMDFFELKVSLKSSDCLSTIHAYQMAAKAYDYPLHLGITEAGTPFTGTIKSCIGLGILLFEGIGDTLRISLTGSPLDEVKVGQEILKTLNLREKGIEIISCPTCGRCEIDLFSIVKEVEERFSSFSHPPLKIAIMGCVVNGPGEAKDADIGIAGGKGTGLIFKRGKVIKKVMEKDLVKTLFSEIETMMEENKGVK
jgi:(E)-4-hydroxy-3-methylbut-2-enyl-diphosphate synthase